jgi:hypothetical protein
LFSFFDFGFFPRSARSKNMRFSRCRAFALSKSTLIGPPASSRPIFLDFGTAQCLLHFITIEREMQMGLGQNMYTNQTWRYAKKVL